MAKHQDAIMRTTLTVDDDVVTALKRSMRESGRSFKDVVNEALRRGLSPAAPDSVPPALPLLNLLPRPGVNLADGLGLLREMDAEYDARKLSHK